MGGRRGLGDEAVDTVGQEFDLQLLGVDLLLSPLVGNQREMLGAVKQDFALKCVTRYKDNGK